MPADQTRNVSLTAELNAFIRNQVASGQYQNASEVVRAALRLLVQQAGGDEPKAPRSSMRGWNARQG
jgi:antitoxin ParD1/3/4